MEKGSGLRKAAWPFCAFVTEAAKISPNSGFTASLAQQCSTTCGIGAIWRTVACSSNNDQDCASTKRPEPARTCNLQPCADWKSGSWSKVIFIELIGIVYSVLPPPPCMSPPAPLSHSVHLLHSVQTSVGWWDRDTGTSSVWILRARGPSDPFTVRMCPAGLSAH